MNSKDSAWFKKKVEIKGRFTETIYEVVTGEDEAGFGFAVADVDHSQMHVHNKTTEIYILISGSIFVVLGDKQVRLVSPGDTVTIPPNAPHYAISSGKNPARVAVLTIPPWSSDDHIPTGPYADEE